MTFASFSTVIAVFENIMSFCMDMFGISRKKAALINCIVILVASLPCVLGYNIWSNLHLIGGRDVLDSEDFLVSNLLLPLGSLIYLLFCVTKWGWGFGPLSGRSQYRKGAEAWTFLKALLPVHSSCFNPDHPDSGTFIDKNCQQKTFQTKNLPERSAGRFLFSHSFTVLGSLFQSSSFRQINPAHFRS